MKFYKAISLSILVSINSACLHAVLIPSMPDLSELRNKIPSVEQLKNYFNHGFEGTVRTISENKTASGVIAASSIFTILSLYVFLKESDPLMQRANQLKSLNTKNIKDFKDAQLVLNDLISTEAALVKRSNVENNHSYTTLADTLSKIRTELNVRFKIDQINAKIALDLTKDKEFREFLLKNGKIGAAILSGAVIADFLFNDSLVASDVIDLSKESLNKLLVTLEEIAKIVSESAAAAQDKVKNYVSSLYQNDDKKGEECSAEQSV